MLFVPIACTIAHRIGIDCFVVSLLAMTISYLDKTYGKAYGHSMKTVSATYARAHFYDLIDEVSKAGTRVGITKKGEIKAVLVGAREYESWHNLAVELITEK